MNQRILSNTARRPVDDLSCILYPTVSTDPFQPLTLEKRPLDHCANAYGCGVAGLVYLGVTRSRLYLSLGFSWRHSSVYGSGAGSASTSPPDGAQTLLHEATFDERERNVPASIWTVQEATSSGEGYASVVSCLLTFAVQRFTQSRRRTAGKVLDGCSYQVVRIQFRQ
jgi:hypothetical protein